MLLNNQFRASSEFDLVNSAATWQGEPRSRQKHVRCCHGFPERFVCVCLCLHECGGEFDGCMCGCCGGNYRELVPNVSVKLIRGKWGKKDSILIANYYQSPFWKNNEWGFPKKEKAQMTIVWYLLPFAKSVGKWKTTTQVDEKCFLILLLIKSDKWIDSNLLIIQRQERDDEGEERVRGEIKKTKKSTIDQWFPDSVRSKH